MFNVLVIDKTESLSKICIDDFLLDVFHDLLEVRWVDLAQDKREQEEGAPAEEEYHDDNFADHLPANVRDQEHGREEVNRREVNQGRANAWDDLNNVQWIQL